MSSLKPVIHGKDHLPGGPDPIPQVVATFDPGSLEEHLQVSSVTIPASSGNSVSWARYSGPALLDLTTPTQPHITVKGVYAVTVAAQWSATITNGDYMDFSLGFVQAALGYPPGTPSFTQSTMINAGGVSVAAVNATVTMVGKMDVGDSMLITAFNAAASNSTFAATIACVLILALP